MHGGPAATIDAEKDELNKDRHRSDAMADHRWQALLYIYKSI